MSGCARKATNPISVTITVQRLWNDGCKQHRVYYVNPEFKGPQDTTPCDTEAAVAATAGEGGTEANNASTWSFTGDETMHPFWAVPRLTPAELARCMALAPNAACNMQLADDASPFQTLTVGEYMDTKMDSLCSVRVPMLTNTRQLDKGDNLVCEAAQKREPTRRTGDWKTEVAQRSKAPKLASPAAAPAKGSATRI
jgi:hypothetical protein